MYDRSRLEQAGIPCFCDPQDAADAVAALSGYAKASACQSQHVQPMLTAAQRCAVEEFLRDFPKNVAA